uniref:Axoneme-associated protein mst101(3)-like n=1 Tax=Nicotiana tabacum TaxID=4097 RepID=A0A1S3YYX7_TOBAC|nr:PREDICTED: axoneme-associated protein mst101(3)-like [Nicotiana tabacum]
MIRGAQAVETCHGEGAHGEEDPFRGYFIGVEDVTGPSDLETLKKSSSEAFVLHYEAFFQSRGELSSYEAEREGEVKGLRPELEASRKEQAKLAEQLRVEVYVVKSEAEEWKKNMDRLASEKETAQTQLASAEAQFRSLKEKALVQAKKIVEFQSRLSSANSDRERLATELLVAKSEVEKAMANVDAMVAVYRSDAEAAQVRAKEIAEIEKAKELEAKTRMLVFPDDDDTGSTSGSESEGGLEVEDAAPGED